MDYALLADAIALAHAAFVVFVVAGQCLIRLGGAVGWRWVRNRWFRGLHLAAIGVVLAQVALGVYCPLTLLEARWRARAGMSDYGETFVGHWVERLIYVDVPLAHMHAIYIAFGVWVAWTLYRYPPEWR